MEKQETLYQLDNNPICLKSEAFALTIIELNKALSEKREFVLSKQIIRSATSVYANVAEAQFAQSKADFNAKMYIALKEAGESMAWLRLLYKSNYIIKEEYEELYRNCQELVRILSAITKKTSVH